SFNSLIRSIAGTIRRYQRKTRKERPVIWAAGINPGRIRRTLRAASGRLGGKWRGRKLIILTRSESRGLWSRACRWTRRRDDDECDRTRETRGGRRPSRREGEKRARRSPSQVQSAW
ncbi:hypothetical protein PENTCL1PPCAC_27899, partial [Pristionchus entomophagus]